MKITRLNAHSHKMRRTSYSIAYHCCVTLKPGWYIHNWAEHWVYHEIELLICMLKHHSSTAGSWSCNLCHCDLRGTSACRCSSTQTMTRIVHQMCISVIQPQRHSGTCVIWLQQGHHLLARSTKVTPLCVTVVWGVPSGYTITGRRKKERKKKKTLSTTDPRFVLHYL